MLGITLNADSLTQLWKSISWQGLYSPQDRLYLHSQYVNKQSTIRLPSNGPLKYRCICLELHVGRA